MTGMATSCVFLWRGRYACGPMMRQRWSSCTTKLRDALKKWENCGVILLKSAHTPPLVDPVGAVGTGPKRVVAGPVPENKQSSKGGALGSLHKHPQSNFGQKDRRLAYMKQ